MSRSLCRLDRDRAAEPLHVGRARERLVFERFQAIGLPIVKPRFSGPSARTFVAGGPDISRERFRLEASDQ